MTTCPSGVHYMHLVDHARAHIEETYRRPLLDRLMRWLLARVLPYPRADAGGAAARRCWRKPFAPLLAALGLKPLAAMLRLAPRRSAAAVPERGAFTRRTAPRRGRVALLPGCATGAGAADQRGHDPSAQPATASRW